MKIKTRKLKDKDLNEFEVQILQNIKQSGWHANGIEADQETPCWAYSVGIYAKYGQPEMIVFGLDIETMYSMIDNYVKLLKKGLIVEESARVSGVLDEKQCMFRSVNPKWRELLLRSAAWYYHYEEFPAVQCFWPDAKGRFPGDAGFRQKRQNRQPLLYESTEEKTGVPTLLEDTPWIFEDHPNTACFTSNFVLEGEPIVFVSHDYDGDWQFHGDQAPSESEPKLVCLESMVSLDSTLESLFDLPRGWAAERKSPKHQWKRFKNHPFPTFEDDGFYLEDVVALAEVRDDLSPPSARRRERCRVGQTVKLLFRFAAEQDNREDGQTERMWVEITEVNEDEGIYTGTLDNDPVHDVLECGETIIFLPEHIAEIYRSK